MQAVYACLQSEQEPSKVFNLLLKEVADEVRAVERRKNLSGDIKLLTHLYFNSIANVDEYNEYIKSKAQNWELNRIAQIDKILMYMAISEMLNFQEIPIKVTINEYLELAKQYSTPKSSRFINGILDSLYSDFMKAGLIKKSGRGLINYSSKR